MINAQARTRNSISLWTAQPPKLDRQWAYARAWLFRRISEEI